MNTEKLPVLSKMIPDNYYRFEVFECRETLKAWGLDLGHGPIWFPKSHVNVGKDPDKPAMVIADIPEWLCRKNNLV